MSPPLSLPYPSSAWFDLFWMDFLRPHFFFRLRLRIFHYHHSGICTNAYVLTTHSLLACKCVRVLLLRRK
ncbi:hypothetical protein K443DRAFT_649669, partial [Laccaria amethystina LaAM-08-1]